MLHNHHFWWRFFPQKELTQVYISAALRYFAVSLISLFIPIYLYHELSYTLSKTLFFFLIYSLVLGLSTPLAAKFAARYGIKHSVLISVPFYMTFLLLLYFLPLFPTPLPLLGILLGISMSFYWMGMHLVFRHVSHSQHRGEEVGKRESLCIFASMIGPIVGGFLIKFTGFKFVFLITSLFLFFSAFFLFLSKENHVKYYFSIRSLFDKRKIKDYLFFISRGSRVIAAGVIWPIFIFIILNDYFSLGIIDSILAGISAILIWLMGKFSDRVGKRKVIRWSVGFESLSWIVRSLVITITHVFGATFLGAITFGVMESPVGALEYDKAKGRTTEFFVDREIFISLGRVLIIVIVLIFDSLTSGFIFQGIASLAALLF